LSEEKKRKNLGTYAICMILAVIILIIFAAMADNREQHFENQIDEKEKLNMSIQNQIVTLTDENYNLKQETQQKTVALEEKEKEVQFYQAMTKAWECYETKEAEEVKKIIDSIDITTLTEEQKNTFNTFCEQWK
jgi:hypothetical protein